MSYVQQQPQAHSQPQPYVQQQPIPTQVMSTTGGNRNVKNLPAGPDGREWSNGICDCCNDGLTCVLAWCFPCIVYGQNKRRLEHLERKGTPDPEHGGCCSSDCMMHGCITCCGCGWVLQMGYRSHVRTRYNVKGGACYDCLSSCCCQPCALTQESQELQQEEESFQGHHVKA